MSEIPDCHILRSLSFFGSPDTCWLLRRALVRVPLWYKQGLPRQAAWVRVTAVLLLAVRPRAGDLTFHALVSSSVKGDEWKHPTQKVVVRIKRGAFGRGRSWC